MLRARLLALCSVIALGALACGGGSTAAPPPPLPAPGPDVAVGDGALTTSLSRVGWLLGDWRYADGSGEEHWVAIGGVIYGVAFVGDRFEVMIVDDDDGQDDGPPEGKLRFLAMPGGAAPVEFAHDRSATSDDATAVFVNPQHDFPTSIVYARPDAARLQATLGGTGGGSVIPMEAAAAVASPDAEAMDRVFASDTAADGIDGWMRHFAADAGAVKHDETGASVRVEGHDAIRAAYQPILEIGALLWEPKWSRLSADGKLAATVGSSTLEKDGKVIYRGNYVTIWRRTEGGPWQVIFDTGRPENSQTRVASAR